MHRSRPHESVEIGLNEQVTRASEVRYCLPVPPLIGQDAMECGAQHACVGQQGLETSSTRGSAGRMSDIGRSIKASRTERRPTVKKVALLLCCMS